MYRGRVPPTWKFRASAGAEGVWEITVDESAYLLDGDALLIESSAGNVAFIRVGLECTAAAHCADGNPCTDDVCDAGECSNPNSSSSTPCDDGLFCTATDLCDGNGTCAGSGTPCTQFFPLCCENLDLCKAANENCWGYEEW